MACWVAACLAFRPYTRARAQPRITPQKYRSSPTSPRAAGWSIGPHAGNFTNFTTRREGPPVGAADFAVLYALGYSLDNLSLMALTIAVGFVVDDAVVVIENTHRHLEAGIGPVEAALKSGRRDRLHRRLDDGVADRRFHPAVPDERLCRA